MAIVTGKLDGKTVSRAEVGHRLDPARFLETDSSGMPGVEKATDRIWTPFINHARQVVLEQGKKLEVEKDGIIMGDVFR